MKKYFVAVQADGYRIDPCCHRHRTVASAVACISSAGGFVLSSRSAKNDGKWQYLTEAEEAEFQMAMYGTSIEKRLFSFIAWLWQAGWSTN